MSWFPTSCATVKKLERKSVVAIVVTLVQAVAVMTTLGTTSRHIQFVPVAAASQLLLLLAQARRDRRDHLVPGHGHRA